MGDQDPLLESGRHSTLVLLPIFCRLALVTKLVDVCDRCIQTIVLQKLLRCGLRLITQSPHDFFIRYSTDTQLVLTTNLAEDIPTFLSEEAFRSFLRIVQL